MEEQEYQVYHSKIVKLHAVQPMGAIQSAVAVMRNSHDTKLSARK